MGRLSAMAAFAVVLFSSTGAALADKPLPEGVTKFIADKGLARYGVALADLDSDGTQEALIYAIASKEGGDSADFCGSGGCTLFVLSLHGNGYRAVSRITVAKPPVRVLNARTNGWHDMSVTVCGGGITRCYDAYLRFDGHKYPTNPSVMPSVPIFKQAGKTLLTDGVFKTSLAEH